jgi:hypothetical protein
MHVKFRLGNLKGGDHLENPGLEWRIMSERVLEKKG